MWPFSGRKAAPQPTSEVLKDPTDSQAPQFDHQPPQTNESSESGSPAAPDPAKMPKPHRCNARVEDFVQALVTWDYSGKIQPSWRLMRRCFKSEPGQEPTEAYLVIKDPETYLEPRRVYSPRPGMER